MEEQLKIKSITLEDDTKIKLKNYIFRSDFEDDVLEYISENRIEYYAMKNLELNTEEYHLENAFEDDLVEALEDNNYDFSKKIDVDDAIDIVEQNGYEVLEKDILDYNLDFFDSNRLREIQDKFINGSWSEREEIYNKIVNG